MDRQQICQKQDDKKKKEKESWTEIGKEVSWICFFMFTEAVYMFLRSLKQLDICCDQVS